MKDSPHPGCQNSGGNSFGRTPWFRVWMALGVGCWALASCTARSDSEPTIRDVADLSFIASITPGKPNAPTEEIRVSMTNAQWTLTARRISAEGEEMAKGTSAVPAAETAALWDASRKFHSVHVQEEGKAYDFGKRLLRFEWSTTSGKRETRELVWTKPLVPEQDKVVDQYLLLLGRLAHERVLGVSLAYFPR